MKITFNELPVAVSALHEKLSNIEHLLLARQETTQPETDQLLTVQETASFLHLSVPTIYGLNSKGELPSCKRGKRLYFSKYELTNWIKAGRKKTVSELRAEADAYLQGTKKGGNP